MSRYAPKNTFTKALYDRRWFLLGWFVGMVFFAWFIGAFYTSFGQSTALNDQLKQLPEALRNIANLEGNINTVPGYFGSQLFGKSTVPLIGIIIGVMLGTVLATEEEAGTLQTVLAAPVSRLRLLLSKWLAAELIFVVVMAGIGLGLALSLWQLHLSLSIPDVLLALFDSWLLTSFFFGLTFAVAAIWGKRSVAIAAGSLVGVATFLLNTMAVAVDSLKPYDKLTPFHYFGNGNPLVTKPTWENMAVLAIASLVLLAAGATVFARRDIGTS